MFNSLRDLMALIDMTDTLTGMLSSLMYVFSFLNHFLRLFVSFCSSNLLVVFFVREQINMKGLDGLQGPIYVGTGCVFRRQALYGYDAPVRVKPPGKTCNCWAKCFSCCCCCSTRRKSKKGIKKQNNGNKRKKINHREASPQIHALESIREEAHGKMKSIPFFIALHVLANSLKSSSFVKYKQNWV